MEACKPPAGGNLLRLATGIEAGVVGGMAMLAVLVAGSLLRGHVWWEIPNLLGTTFYGPRVLHSDPGLAAAAGVALHLSLAGGIGAVFGAICGGWTRRTRLLWLGLATGLLTYFIADSIFWPRVNPLVPLYVSTPVSVLSYVIFGACLGFIGRRPETRRDEAGPPPDGVE